MYNITHTIAVCRYDSLLYSAHTPMKVAPADGEQDAGGGAAAVVTTPTDELGHPTEHPALHRNESYIPTNLRMAYTRSNTAKNPSTHHMNRLENISSTGRASKRNPLGRTSRSADPYFRGPIENLFTSARWRTQPDSREGSRLHLAAIGMQRAGRFIIDPRRSHWVPMWDFVMLGALLFTLSVTPIEVVFLNEGSNINALWLVNRIIDLIFLVRVAAACTSTSPLPATTTTPRLAFVHALTAPTCAQPTTSIRPSPPPRRLAQFDMLLIFHLAYQEDLENGGHWVFNRRLIVRRYLCGWFGVDLISILPFWIMTLDYADPFGKSSGGDGTPPSPPLAPSALAQLASSAGGSEGDEGGLARASVLFRIFRLLRLLKVGLRRRIGASHSLALGCGRGMAALASRARVLGLHRPVRRL